MSNTPKPSAREPRPDKDFIARYRELVIRRYDALTASKANRFYDQLAALRRKIRAAGEAESRRILTLLDDPHLGVRYQAAFDALSLDLEAGLRTLRELEAGPRSQFRLDAHWTLQAYAEGDMDLQPWNKKDRSKDT